MNKTALITGASVGLGYEFAKIFAREGYDLVLIARSEERLAAVKSEIMDKYERQVNLLVVDLSAPTAPQLIFDELKALGIEVDVLINNAGFGTAGRFVNSDWYKEANMIDLNVRALVHLTRIFLPGMVQRKHGKILNVASTAAFQAGPMMSVYYASKAFVLHFSEAIANELKGTGVTLTCLCPGPTATEFQKRAGLEGKRLFQVTKFMTASEVCEYGFRALMSGQAVAVPGLMNKVLAFATRLSPRSMAAEIARGLQE